MTSAGHPADAGEFVTVADACARLDLTLRTGQRYAAKLSQSDVSVSQSGGPRLVRFSAMQERARRASASKTGKEPTETTKSDESQSVVNLSQSDATMAQTVADSVAVAETAKDALISQLQGENARLWAALEQSNANVKAEQENTKAALAQIAEARREGQMIMGAVAAGRLEIAAQASETEPSPTATQDAQSEAQADTGEQVDQVEKQRPFWAFWRR